MCNGKGYLRRDVPLDHPEFGRLVPCQCRVTQIEAQRFSLLREVGNLGHLGRMTFETFVPEGYGLPPHKRQNLRAAYQRARRFADDPQGWLVIRGGYGCGKTHLAAAIANRRISQGQPAIFVVVPDLLDHLRSTWTPNNPVSFDQRFDEVRGAPLLILDDLGTQSSTSWAQEKLFQIFNHRYNAQLPTVVTTNHELKEIDLRLRSRLVDPDLTDIIDIKAADFRGLRMSQDQSDISTLSLHTEQTFSSFDPRAYELPGEEGENLRRATHVARQYAESPEGWLVLTGTYGCGKTHLAAAIANHRVSQDYPALFVVVPDLLDHLRATFSPQSPISYDKRFEEIRAAALLILDDLGTQSATPWAKEKLFQIINYRYNARLPTVITTADEIENIDPRLRARFLDISRCTLFAIIAPAYHGGTDQKQHRSRQRRTSIRSRSP